MATTRYGMYHAITATPIITLVKWVLVARFVKFNRAASSFLNSFLEIGGASPMVGNKGSFFDDLHSKQHFHMSSLCIYPRCRGDIAILDSKPVALDPTAEATYP
ncbi:hypothetical protein N7471_010083 [Penicillium samsonianum]|uniref:uncharacterized protein n=1 Tax=Penicillium samsonianum TaxID=1882272 RepID=UPI0025485498|nr:uncharacterized protein N7471_010083 [Penicillium samsonianum]KAJ6128866.1 hypothetical protein N7471_010083 [Penicillium samsonianum]